MSLETEKKQDTNEYITHYKDYDISEEIQLYSNFDSMGLDENVLRGIYSYGFEEPSAIQRLAIMPVIAGRDIIAQSQSGTGKTATFMISILNKIDPSQKCTQAIVIAPTRELADQIFKVFKVLSEYTEITGDLCIGGAMKNKYSYYEVIDHHVIVGTPGRLSDLISKDIIKTNNLKMAVVDEADEVLSTSFQKQIVKIFQKFKPEMGVQVCLFSATIPDEMFILTDKILKDPIKILVKDEELSLDGIKQYYVFLGDDDNLKFDTLCDLYQRISIGQAMVYCNKRSRVEDLTNYLKKENYSVSMIHGEMQQKERQAVMKQFREGEFRILVSTDITARGIDVQQVSLVINYDVPKDSSTYIHRIGRSGRYGRKGVAINFALNSDQSKIKNIENAYKIKIEPLPKDVENVIEQI
jgi:superfamily II DNA/RNA helicase